MVAKVNTLAFLGINVIPVHVEVKITSGAIPSFTIVGLPDKAVGESKERVRAAISSTGIEWPAKKIIVNLAPADIQKEGSHYDLAIALGILLELGVIEKDAIKSYFILGELSLDGSINSVNGILAAAVGSGKKNMGIICPQANGNEASWAGDLDIVAPENLLSLINHLKGSQTIARPQSKKIILKRYLKDLSEVKFQDKVKRALEIAAAGGHNILMVGFPGTGKSMLASRLCTILPDLEAHEILETNMIHSISGEISNDNLVTNRPYREVHHSCSMPALIGGGALAKPGEISLAHNGVLFLDELAEFPRQVLDSLRQPLENGNVTISRVNCRTQYPANFQLIAAMNPCRCGYLGDKKKECNKAPICGQEYKNKISGPLLDRIDIIVDVQKIDSFLATRSAPSEPSSEVRKRVIKARNIQNQRYKSYESMKDVPKINAKINNQLVDRYCEINNEDQEILKNSIERIGISMRGVSKILKVARTIADLDSEEKINSNHLLEAISYRKNL